MTNSYLVLKAKQQEEVNNFPMVFAFSNSQFEEAMTKLGLQVTDTDKIFSIGGGGYIRKTDSDALSEMFLRHSKEKQEAIDGDLTGEGYVYEMFEYELGNHEYGYTYDVEPTLDALGLTFGEVRANEKLSNALKKARTAVSRRDN